MGLRKKILSFASPLLKPLTNWYLSKPRYYEHKKIKLGVFPGVFHPGLFFSTKILIKYTAQLPLFNRAVLELGAGSGLLSLYCAKHGATVTASDINPKAIINLQQNAKTNNLPIKIVKSDLFEKIDPNDFDLILINPPYYPHNPINESQMAWYCGENFEYFRKLFEELNRKLTRKNTQVLMILSEDCEIDRIFEIGDKYGINKKLLLEDKAWGERSFIYSISANN